MFANMAESPVLVVRAGCTVAVKGFIFSFIPESHHLPTAPGLCDLDALNTCSSLV